MKIKVLIAEDSTLNQQLIGSIFESLGCRPVLADNGVEVVNLWKQGEFDLIFMDCQMPVMDGLCATRKIRELEELSHSQPIPIIALTAMIVAGTRDSCLEAGMDDYLSKPYNVTQINEMLMKWVM